MKFENTFDKLRDEFPVDLSEKVSELQAEIKSLKAQLEGKEQLEKLLYCCDGLSTAYAQNNHGEVQEWLRHVDAAYQALKESK
jgi:hypothetical protein